MSYLSNMKFEIINQGKNTFKRIYIKIYKASLGDWSYNLMIQHKCEKRELLPHYYDRSIPNSQQKIIVYVNNGWTWHAGLCDRLRAITALYDWCKHNNETYKINFVHPFSLQDYLIPNEYDWTLKENELSYNSKYVMYIRMMYGPDVERLRLSGQLYPLVNKWMDDKLTVDKRQIHVYTNLFTDRSWKCFGKSFNELFKPAPKLQEQINDHLEEINGKYISISFRFTTLLGDFEDCTTIVLSSEERNELINKCLNIVAEIRKQAPAHERVLVTADSLTFIERVKQLPDVYVIPGKIGHIDYQHDDDVNMKTFLDFFLISKAEKVYLAKSGQMYRSAFAKTAAMVNDKPFEMYEF